MMAQTLNDVLWRPLAYATGTGVNTPGVVTQPCRVHKVVVVPDESAKGTSDISCPVWDNAAGYSGSVLQCGYGSNDFGPQGVRFENGISVEGSGRNIINWLVCYQLETD